MSAGRLIDRRGPRPVMTAGSVLGSAAAAGIAAAPSYGWFVAAWLLASGAMAGLFYPPAFAALTGWYGPHRARALTTLTLAAGFSSTIFAPLTATLAGHLSWRGVYLVLAVVLSVVTIPAHGLTLGLPWPQPPRARPGGVSRNRQVLTSRGMSAAEAAWALGLGGGRLAGTSAVSGILMTGTRTRPQDHVGGQIVGQNPANDRLP